MAFLELELCLWSASKSQTLSLCHTLFLVTGIIIIYLFFRIYSFLRLSTADLPAHEQHPREHMPSSYLLKTRDTSNCQQNVLALARRKSLFNSELLNTATAHLNLFAMTSQLSAVTFLSSCSNKASSAGACGTASASDSSYLGGSGNESRTHLHHITLPAYIFMWCS